MNILSRKTQQAQPAAEATAPAPDPAQLLKQQIEAQRDKVDQLRKELKAEENLLLELRSRQGTCYVIYHRAFGYRGNAGQEIKWFQDILDPHVWSYPTPWAALTEINKEWKESTVTPEIRCIKRGAMDSTFRMEYEGLMGRGRYRFFSDDGEIT